MRGGTLAPLALCLLAVAAPAQADFRLEVLESPQEPIAPEVGAGRIALRAWMDCQTAWLASIPPLDQSIIVTLTPSTPSPHVRVQGPGTIPLPIDGCTSPLSPDVHADANFTVASNRRAPGLVPIGVQIDAVAPPGGRAVLLQGESKAQAFANVTIDYFPYVQAQVGERTLSTDPGGEARFAIDLANYGNAPTRARLRIANPLGDGWHAAVPESVVLDAPSDGGPGRGRAELVVHAPAHFGWNNAEQAIQVILIPVAAADEGKQGTPISVSVMARARGFAAASADGSDAADARASPAAGPVALLALGALAAALRRRHAP